MWKEFEESLHHLLVKNTSYRITNLLVLFEENYVLSLSLNYFLKKELWDTPSGFDFVTFIIQTIAFTCFCRKSVEDESQLFLLLFQLLDFLTCIPNNYSIEYTNVATGRKEWGQVHGSRSAYLFSEAFITSCSRNMIDWSCHALDGYELLSSWLISSYAKNQFLWVCSLSFPSHPSSLICF